MGFGQKTKAFYTIIGIGEKRRNSKNKNHDE